jgi:lysophospholipase L1-like esterase
MLLRFRQDVINLKPQLVVILAGINDIAENTGPSTIEMILNNIISMVELAKNNGIEVMLCSVLPAAEFPWSPTIKPAQIVIELNKKIKLYAEQNTIIYIDYFSVMKNELNGMRKDLANDGIHPNKKGYAIMEPILSKKINQIFNK